MTVSVYVVCLYDLSSVHVCVYNILHVQQNRVYSGYVYLISQSLRTLYSCKKLYRLFSVV